MSEGSGWSPMTDYIIAEADRIEDAKHGKALTPEEVTTLRACHALRLMAPYAFKPLKQPDCPGCRDGECPTHLGTPSHLGDHS